MKIVFEGLSGLCMLFRFFCSILVIDKVVLVLGEGEWGFEME